MGSVFLLGIAGSLVRPAPGKQRGQLCETSVFSQPGSSLPTVVPVLGPTEPQGQHGCSELGQGDPWVGTPCASPGPGSVAERARGAPRATAHLRPGHTAGIVSKDILTG